jgi:hypothetical protein
MKTGYLIEIDRFCINHNIETSFISTLQETGLIEITTVQETAFIDAGELQQLEKYVRLHYDLDINLQGIETITHLLDKVIAMQDEIITLKNRLRLYERKVDARH